eukprot:TRINITY_DN12319_c0_g1_i1.p1 TRINITY_DN12319_c0_g1~~TRINITY_DN12319_c0_g1_i1.p1  ORF type:complete len:497 (-),score=92.44 TRINITY_DN12319_c0_g1_i1:72-1562(-)
MAIVSSVDHDEASKTSINEDEYGSAEQVRKYRALRLLSLVTGYIALLSSGTLYAFSLYGDDLKDNLGWNQTELNIVAAFGNNGLYIGGIVYGVFYDKYGARLSLLHGSLCGFVGYFMMYLVDRKDITANVWLSSFFYLLIGFGCCASTTAALTTNIKNYPPKYRGLVTGTSLACFGLSAFILSLINSLFYKDDETPANFLLFMAIYTSVSNLIAAAFVQDIPSNLLMTKEEAQKEESIERQRKLKISEEALLSDDTTPLTNSEEKTDIGGWDLVRHPHYWMLFTITTIQAGAGLMYINNVGTIVSSLVAVNSNDDSDDEKSIQVSALSIANSLGRLAIGGFSDWAVKKWTTIPRASYLFINITLAVIAQCVLAFSGDIDPSFVTLPTILNGAAYGGILVLTTIVLSEEFGTTHFGTNYGLLTVGVAAGGQLLNVLFGVFYDDEVEKQKDEPNETESDCIGSRCYSTVMIVAMAMSVISSCCVTALTIRKRKQMKIY